LKIDYGDSPYGLNYEHGRDVGIAEFVVNAVRRVLSRRLI